MLDLSWLGAHPDRLFEVALLSTIRIRCGRLGTVYFPYMIVAIVTLLDLQHELRTGHVGACAIVVKSLITPGL